MFKVLVNVMRLTGTQSWLTKRGNPKFVHPQILICVFFLFPEQSNFKESCPMVEVN